MDLVWLKVITVGSTLLITAIGILLSRRLRKFAAWFDVGCALSAGVILATGLTHMLPEAMEDYAVALGSDGSHTHGANDHVHHDHSDHSHDDHDHHGHSHDDHVHIDQSLNESGSHTHAYPMVPLVAGLAFLLLFLVEKMVVLIMTRYKKPKSVASSETHIHGHSQCGEECVANVEESVSTSVPQCCEDIHSLNKLPEMAALALLVAISLHAVIEGMGLGSADRQETLLSMFTGIAAHKALEGFAVGANLIEAQVTTRRFWTYSIVTIFATPLGALIGYLAQDVSQGGFASPIISAMAVGTFLQVASMELLPRTFAKPSNFGIKAVGLLVGFGVMSTMPLWAEHEH